MLVDNGADLDIEDHIGTTARSIIENPGPISASDAIKYLNIEQRPVRKIERVIHPERLVGGEMGGWPGGNGGWDDRRLAGFEEDMHCDIDQVRVKIRVRVRVTRTCH
jgi:hypothetical protein